MKDWIVKLFLPGFAVLMVGILINIFILDDKEEPSRPSTSKSRDFYYKSVSHLLDFSKRNIVEPARLGEKSSPVTWARTITAKRIGKDPTLVLTFATRGNDIDIEVTSHPFKTLVSKDRSGPDSDVTTYNVNIDISKEPENSTFTVLTNSVFWNAFQPGNTIAGIIVEDETESITVVLDGGKVYQFEDVIAASRPRNSDEYPTPLENQGIRVGPDRNVVTWNIPDPKVDTVYFVKWRFVSDPTAPDR